MGVLAVLGLTELAEQVHAALLRTAGADIGQLARDVRASRPRVAAAVQELEGRGLAVALAGNDGRFAAAPPEPALDALVHEQQQALARVRAHAQQLALQARSAAEHARPEDLVAVVVGSEAVNTHFVQLQRLAEREVLSLDRPPYPRTAGTGRNTLADERMAAGVVYRTVYDRSLLEVPALFARVQDELAHGEHGRVLADLPLKLAVADRAMALLPLIDAGPGVDQAALAIRPSVLLDSLVALFEALWARAHPLDGLVAADADGLDPELVEVVRLMAVGLTDEAIARHLGTSDRTVRRRIAAALDALGADTRFQAGLRAHELGWVAGTGTVR